MPRPRSRALRRAAVAAVLIAGAALGLAAQAGGQDQRGSLTDVLTEQNWFVDDVREADDTTTVTFAWTESYFAARACLATLNGLDTTDAESVSVVFGGSDPLTCAQVRADPLAAVWTPPEGESEGG